MNNKLIIAAAGSGKTTYLVNKALEIKSDPVLITTYTEANEAEIKKKIIKKIGYIPANINICTWFSFLLKDGVRPFQNIMDDDLHEKEIGFYLTSQKSGHRGGNVYWGEDNFYKFYFTESMKIYSDKISKFVFKCNEKSGGQVISRIAKVYKHIFIDEVQDLAGFDLELIKLFFQNVNQVFLVGDPRQVTYLTHHTTKYEEYKNGKIVEFIKEKLGKRIVCEIDYNTLNVSHRNNLLICYYASKLYPDFPAVNACTCTECRDSTIEHQGVFLLRKLDIDNYLRKYKPVQLRWNSRQNCDKEYPIFNFGESKGLTFDRVLIYPTREMIEWIRNNSHELKNETLAKFYVGITRARYSSTIVMDYNDDENFDGINKYYIS